jgi:hypothetical protein
MMTTRSQRIRRTATPKPRRGAHRTDRTPASAPSGQGLARPLVVRVAPASPARRAARKQPTRLRLVVSNRRPRLVMESTPPKLRLVVQRRRPLLSAATLRVHAASITAPARNGAGQIAAAVALAVAGLAALAMSLGEIVTGAW